MNDAALLPFAAAALIATAMASAAALRAWTAWLELRRDQIATGRRFGSKIGSPDIVRLRERVRRLEAIANGADL
ncbi:MAG TPA: hypothetical protein VGD66_14760 [Allosphingosinicella sp.]|jgi:post-segregation antitoxin (ccd killing protein)